MVAANGSHGVWWVPEKSSNDRFVKFMGKDKIGLAPRKVGFNLAGYDLGVMEIGDSVG